MADVKWIKIVTDIFDDEKILLIETLPEADSIIVVWFKLLCLAGKQNNSGVFTLNNSMPYTDKMFATIFRRKESTVQLALNTFEKFGMIEVIDNTITIPNWGKHQSVDMLQDRRDYMREYMAEYRQKQKLIACKTDRKVNSKANSKANVNLQEENKKKNKNKNKNSITAESADSLTDYDSEFELLWKNYPNKKGKDSAKKDFIKSRKSGVSLEAIEKGIEKYKKYIEHEKIEQRFVKHGSTFFHQHSWEDSYDYKVKNPRIFRGEHEEIREDDIYEVPV